jgi:hypothetical protein
MRFRNSWCLALVLVVGGARADQPAAGATQDTWDAAFLEGGKAGYVQHQRARG